MKALSLRLLLLVVGFFRIFFTFFPHFQKGGHEDEDAADACKAIADRAHDLERFPLEKGEGNEEDRDGLGYDDQNFKSDIFHLFTCKIFLYKL